MRARVATVVRQAINAADPYELKGTQRWEFFYLFERTSRWAAAAQSGIPGIKTASFSGTEFIQAVCALPDVDKTTNPFNRHLVATLMPAWAGIPYASKHESDELMVVCLRPDALRIANERASRACCASGVGLRSVKAGCDYDACRTVVSSAEAFPLDSFRKAGAHST